MVLNFHHYNNFFEEKKAKMDAMNEKLSVSAIDSAIELKLSVIDSAKKLIKDFDYKGKSVEEIKKEVVSSKMDMAWWTL